MMVLQHLTENIYENCGPGLSGGLRWIDMQNYRDPPPYPGHSKQVYTNQPGFRQSYSGSETSTDVSLSSNENLATTQRQEPQGEETQVTGSYNIDLGNTDGTSYSILERLGMPACALDSSGNMIKVSVATLSQNRTPPTLASSSTILGNAVSCSPLYSHGHLTVPQWQLGSRGLHRQVNSTQNEVMTRLGEYSSTCRTESELMFSSSASTLAAGSHGGGGSCTSYTSTSSRTGSNGESSGAGSGFLSSALSSSSSYHYLSPRVAPVSTYHHPHPYVNTHWIVGGEEPTRTSHSSTSSSPYSSTYSQSGASPDGGSPYPSHGQSLSYLTTLPPPPEYPGQPRTGVLSQSAADRTADIRTCRSYEAMLDKMDTQRSHPDLRLCASSPGICMRDLTYQSPQGSANNSTDDSDQASIAAKASQMVEMLTGENRSLREELALSTVKVAKLQKFELEIQKVHEAHEALVKSSQKQEALWLAMRRKLEERIKGLETQKIGGVDMDGRVKLTEKDAMISKLLSQNEDLTTARDHLEGENSQLMLSLAEQRARVDILENALLNAQTKVMTLEEEYLKKQTYIGKVEQLQKALLTLQAASERQKEKEMELRAHLEREIEISRTHEMGGGPVMKSELGKDDTKNVGALRKMLEQKDAKIQELEAEMTELEQKYVKEVTIRQLTMQEASQSSKEKHVSSLEKSSCDIEKLIDEVKSQKLKHIEDLHQSQRKVTELEAKVKQLQTRLVEKEAMVKVFQHSPMGRSSSLHALSHQTHHSAHPSLVSPPGRLPGTQMLETLDGGNYRELTAIRHMKTGSASAVELGRKMSMEDDLLSKVQSLNTASKSDSEDEGQLFHV